MDRSAKLKLYRVWKSKEEGDDLEVGVWMDFLGLSMLCDARCLSAVRSVYMLETWDALKDRQR